MNIQKIEYKLNELLKISKELESADSNFSKLFVELSTKKEKLIDLIDYKTTTNENKYKTFAQQLGNIYDSLEEKTRVNFTSNNFINYNNGFYLDTENGILYVEPCFKNEIKIKDYVFSNDKKTIKFNFFDFEIINFLYFEFYKKNGDSQNLNNVKIFGESLEQINGSYKIQITDSFIKNFDDNYKIDDFSKALLINPKKVKSISFEFEDEIDINNYKINFFAYEFDYSDKKEIVLKIPNNYSSGSFKFNKTSYEKNIGLNFEFSYDGVEYTEFDFNKMIKNEIYKTNESSVISENIEKFDNFFIKIKNSDFKTNSSIEKIQQEKERFLVNFTTKTELTISEQIIDDSVFFIIPDAIKVAIDKNNVMPEVFIKMPNGYMINNFFLKIVDEINDDNKQYVTSMKYEDIELKNKKFLIYYCKKNKTFYFPGYMENVYIQYNYLTEVVSIDNKFFTPIIFDLTIKNSGGEN